MNTRTLRFALVAIPFAAASFAATASADRGKDAALTYTKGATAEETYASIQKAARDFCRDEYSNSSAISGVWPTAVANCTAMTVDLAVRQSGVAQLEAYHLAQTGDSESRSDDVIIVTAENDS